MREEACNASRVLPFTILPVIEDRGNEMLTITPSIADRPINKKTPYNRRNMNCFTVSQAGK
ncbi:hypothetical protein [Alkalispirochaeta americana]|uniref:hypothetical protein n=1 Tax=Alkalispirochaeta americana TaxID=159291 RepID=UPI0013563C32|nr:hypothetical protein [Alkalispirochaeta americana]